MAYKSLSNQGSGGGGGGVSSINTQTGPITLQSSGGTITITSPSAGIIDLEGSAASSNLGTSATAANPAISGDATTGFYTGGAGLVDVAISGVKVAEWSSAGYAVTATNANALIVGPTGATNPTFQVSSNSGTDGIQIASSSTAGPSITVLSTGSNQELNIIPKGQGTSQRVGTVFKNNTSNIANPVKYEGISGQSSAYVVNVNSNYINASGGYFTFAWLYDITGQGIAAIQASSGGGSGPSAAISFAPNGTAGATATLTTVATWSPNGMSVAPGPTSLTTPHLVYTGAADTGVTAEGSDVFFNMARTRQHTTGNLATQRDFLVFGATHSFVAASTITNHAVQAIAFIGQAGTNATYTNSSGILIQPQAITGAVVNTYGINIAATTGATNNFAAQFLGPTRFGPTTAPSGTGLTGGEFWTDSTQVARVSNIGGNILYNRAALFMQTASNTVTNTITATSVFGTGIGTKSIAANTMTPGKTINILLGGTYGATTLIPNLTISVLLNAVVIATTTITNLQGNTPGQAFQLNTMIQVQTNGATGTVTVNGNINYATNAFIRGFAPLNNGGAAATFNSTIAQTVDVQATWSVASATNQLLTSTATVEITA